MGPCRGRGAGHHRQAHQRPAAGVGGGRPAPALHSWEPPDRVVALPRPPPAPRRVTAPATATGPQPGRGSVPRPRPRRSSVVDRSRCDRSTEGPLEDASRGRAGRPGRRPTGRCRAGDRRRCGPVRRGRPARHRRAPSRRLLGRGVGDPRRGPLRPTRHQRLVHLRSTGALLMTATTPTSTTTSTRASTTTGTAATRSKQAAPQLPEELLVALKRMRLPYLRAIAPEVLATARAQRWDPAEVVRVLLEEEIRGRDEATRRMRRKAAGLPAGKTFESWRETDSSIPPGTQTGLATLEWVARAENLAIAGPSGTGKTHFVEALAHKVIDARMRVSWFTLESLTAAIGRATVDGSVAKTIARITRTELIVIDDIGMLPAGQAAGEAFYRVVDAAYERRSIAVTSNLHPSGFDTIMPKTLATATVDRLLHHAHVVLTEGTSLRLSEATAGRGVVPLE